MYNLITISSLFTLVVLWTYYKKSDNLLYKDGTTGNLAAWNFRHLAGIALLFIIPFFFMGFDTSFMNAGIYKGYTPSLLIVTGFILFNLSLFTGINLPAPVNVATTQKNNYFIAILFRVFFLAAYEYFFRGILLFTLISSTGVLLAVCIDTALYLMLHLLSDLPLVISTIPFGIFLCWITIETTSILPAILLHWLIALPQDAVAVQKITRSLIKVPI